MGIDLTSNDSVENGVRLTRGARRLIRDLVKIREQRGLTKLEVAKSVGINRSGVTRFEAQENEPRLETVVRYAHAVGASVTFLVESTEDWNERTAAAVDRPRRKRALWRQSDEDEANSSVRNDTEWTQKIVRAKSVLR